MKSRKYIVDENKLNASETEKFKDFDSVVNRVNANPNPGPENGSQLTKAFGLGKGFLLVAALAVAVWYFVFKEKTPTNEVVVSETADSIMVEQEPTYEINAPIANLDVDYESFVINAQEDVTLTTARKTEITIKKNTFQDSSGNLATGDLTIKFREFHDPIDVFRSGIPMQYDSAGTNYTFESAGMFELIAEQNGKPLSKDFKEEVVVDLVSKNGDKKFNNYYFDEDKGEWEFKSKSEVVKIEEKPKKRNDNTDLINENLTFNSQDLVDVNPKDSNKEKELRAPTLPQFPSLLSNKYAFDVDFNKKEFRELNDKVVFQVDESVSKFSVAYYDVDWDSVNLERGDKKGKYNVVLKKGKKTINVVCFPAIPKKEYDRLMVQYNKDLVQYRERLKKYNETKKPVRPRNRRMTTGEVKVINTLNEFATEAKFPYRRRMRIRRGGAWNTDHPLNVRATTVSSNIVRGVFTLDNKEIDIRRSYNVVGARNVLMSAGINADIVYSKTKRNLMWVITEDDNIAIANPGDFRDIQGDTRVFAMTEYEGMDGIDKLKSLMKRK